jgi:hypothetical protein
MRTVAKALLVITIFLGSATQAMALPMLQLGIAGGVYDPVTETIVATSDPFVVTAILTPKNNAKPADIAALLADTYYLSVALTPQIGPVNSSLGSFSVNGTSYNATSGMTYGVPPMESVFGLMPHDPGDLAQHGLYPTFFVEQAFQFTSAQKTIGYNTASAPGGLTPSASGTSYYVSFTVDSRLLDPAYQLHFDLYNSSVVTCKKSGNCVPGDIDIDDFAPFSHDAQGGTRRQVPEPTTWSSLMIGLGVAAGGLRKARKALKN